MFKDGAKAGRIPADELRTYQDHDHAVILTVPRGEFPIGNILAKELHLPLTWCSLKNRPSNVRGVCDWCVTLVEIIVNKDTKQVSEGYIRSETMRIRSLLQERKKL